MKSDSVDSKVTVIGKVIKTIDKIMGDENYLRFNTCPPMIKLLFSISFTFCC